MSNATFCGVESLYLALNAPNYGKKATLPVLLTPDPNASLLRILMPSLLLPLITIMLFLSSKFQKSCVSIVGAGLGYVVASGALFGRPASFPTDTSCWVQYVSSGGGGIAGALVAVALMYIFPRGLAIVNGASLSFVIFNTFPTLDSLVTGFAFMDNLGTLFLGWGWLAWTSTVVLTLVSCVACCWRRFRRTRVAALIAISSGWTVTQSVGLLTRNQTTLKNTLPLTAPIIILAGSIVVFFTMQMVCFSRTRRIARSVEEVVSRRTPNSIHLVHP